MGPLLLYIACVLGAVGLYLLLRPGGRGGKVLGMMLGGAAAAWLLAGTGGAISDVFNVRPDFFFWVFAILAIACAVRMITHPRPVFSALYFILVVLSSAALFLLMEAEFMAFALIIVYGGAILVTYLFVLMLAQQSSSPDDIGHLAEYDRLPREPVQAVVVGFLVLALLTQTFYGMQPHDPLPPGPIDGRMQAWHELEMMPQQLEEIIDDLEDERFVPGSLEAVDGALLQIAPDGRTAEVSYLAAVADPDTGEVSQVRRQQVLTDEVLPNNVQRVGLALVARFPASLEVAGVILLLAMFGAVVLARRQIELGEDELRRMAGMRRYALDVSEDPELNPPGPTL